MSDVNVNLKCFVCCFTLLTLFCQQQGGNDNTKRERKTRSRHFYIFQVQQVNSCGSPSALSQHTGAGRVSEQSQTRCDPCATPTAWWHFPRGFIGHSMHARVSPGAQQDARPSSVAGLFQLAGWHFLYWGNSYWTQETCLWLLSCRSEASDTISGLMADAHTHKQRLHCSSTHTHAAFRLSSD